MNTDTIKLEAMKHDRCFERECVDNRERLTTRVPQVVMTTVLSIVVTLQAWILMKIVDGGERMARIETRLLVMKP